MSPNSPKSVLGEMVSAMSASASSTVTERKVFSVYHVTAAPINLSVKTTRLIASSVACLSGAAGASPGAHSTPKAQPFKPSYSVTSQSSVAAAQSSRKGVRSPPKRPTLVVVMSSESAALISYQTSRSVVEGTHLATASMKMVSSAVGSGAAMVSFLKVY